VVDVGTTRFDPMVADAAAQLSGCTVKKTGWYAPLNRGVIQVVEPSGQQTWYFVAHDDSGWRVFARSYGSVNGNTFLRPLP
jgi:hypothetical protein